MTSEGSWIWSWTVYLRWVLKYNSLTHSLTYSFTYLNCPRLSFNGLTGSRPLIVLPPSPSLTSVHRGWGLQADKRGLWRVLLTPPPRFSLHWRLENGFTVSHLRKPQPRVSPDQEGGRRGRRSRPKLCATGRTRDRNSVGLSIVNTSRDY